MQDFLDRDREILNRPSTATSQELLTKQVIS